MARRMVLSLTPHRRAASMIVTYSIRTSSFLAFPLSRHAHAVTGVASPSSVNPWPLAHRAPLPNRRVIARFFSRYTGVARPHAPTHERRHPQSVPAPVSGDGVIGEHTQARSQISHR